MRLRTVRTCPLPRPIASIRPVWHSVECGSVGCIASTLAILEDPENWTSPWPPSDFPDWQSYVAATLRIPLWQAEALCSLAPDIEADPCGLPPHPREAAQAVRNLLARPDDDPWTHVQLARTAKP